MNYWSIRKKSSQNKSVKKENVLLVLSSQLITSNIKVCLCSFMSDAIKQFDSTIFFMCNLFSQDLLVLYFATTFDELYLFSTDMKTKSCRTTTNPTVCGSLNVNMFWQNCHSWSVLVLFLNFSTFVKLSESYSKKNKCH